MRSVRSDFERAHIEPKIPVLKIAVIAVPRIKLRNVDSFVPEKL